MKLYCTIFKDGKTLPVGFVKNDYPKGDQEAEDSIQLQMVFAAIESLGYEIHFSEKPGDIGDKPEEGYMSIEEWKR